MIGLLKSNWNVCRRTKMLALAVTRVQSTLDFDCIYSLYNKGLIQALNWVTALNLSHFASGMRWLWYGWHRENSEKYFFRFKRTRLFANKTPIYKTQNHRHTQRRYFAYGPMHASLSVWYECPVSGMAMLRTYLMFEDWLPLKTSFLLLVIWQKSYNVQTLGIQCGSS